MLPGPLQGREAVCRSRGDRSPRVQDDAQPKTQPFFRARLWAEDPALLLARAYRVWKQRPLRSHGLLGTWRTCPASALPCVSS